MDETLSAQITAKLIGSYMKMVRDAQHEQDIQKLARDLRQVMTRHVWQTVELPPLRQREAGSNNHVIQVVFLVNDQVLVLLLKVVHLRSREWATLERLLAGTHCTVGLVLNFGSRTPEFWRIQKDAEKE